MKHLLSDGGHNAIRVECRLSLGSSGLIKEGPAVLMIAGLK